MFFCWYGMDLLPVCLSFQKVVNIFCESGRIRIACVMDELGRKNGDSIVLGHFLVGSVTHCFCLGVLEYIGLEVVRCKDTGAAAEIRKWVDIASDPVLLLHVQKGS